VATKFYMVAPICEASLWNCFMSIRLMPRILMCLLDFSFLENMSTTEVNYCLPFGRVRKTTRNLRIVHVAAETATEHHSNSCHLPICVSKYSRVTFQYYIASVKLYVTVKRRPKL
jgi:hypothetical protein